MRVGDGQGVEVCRGDAEVLREQLRGVSEAGDAAVVVMQDDEVPSRCEITAGFGDDAQHRHCLERGQGDSAADVALYGGLTGREAEYIDGSTRGSTQPMIVVFIDGMIFRSAEKRLLANASLRWVKVSITLIWMFVSILARPLVPLVRCSTFAGCCMVRYRT